MKIRIASTLLALALPLVAQAPAAAPQVEATFYKAYYLEKGKRDFDGAMALYSAFLAKAPTHKLAGEAAKQQFRLLDRTGKSKERDAFKAKYSKLLANVGTTAARPARGAGDAGARPGRGDGARPERSARGEGARGEGARGQRGGNRRGGGSIFGLLRNETKVADMTKEQITELKTGLESATGMIDRMRERMGDEVADKLSKGAADLTKALAGDDKAAAQKALDALKEAMGGMFGGGRRGGRGGEEGGGRGGRGGEQGGGRGGRGGNREGGGGGGGTTGRTGTGTTEGGGGGGGR